MFTAGVMAIEIAVITLHKMQRRCVGRFVSLGQQGIPRNRGIANHPLTIWILEDI